MEVCECGKRKPPASRSCDRCGFLDRGHNSAGGGWAAGDIISAMRESGSPMTIAELSNSTGIEYTAVDHALRRMIRSGRVSRTLPEYAGGSHHCGGHVYELSGGEVRASGIDSYYSLHHP
jgi:hypothetical protein